MGVDPQQEIEKLEKKLAGVQERLSKIESDEQQETYLTAVPPGARCQLEEESRPPDPARGYEHWHQALSVPFGLRSRPFLLDFVACFLILPSPGSSVGPPTL